MSHTQSDAELDRAAQAYAFQHHVSYSEALQAVVFLNSPPASYSEPQAQSDAEIDRAAQVYAFQHQVSYREALQAVVSVRFRPPASYSESHALNADVQLDRAATAYSEAYSVNYAESLNSVCFDGAASFREASTNTGSQLLARQPIEIFRAGTHTDSNGTQRTFTLADVQAMAASYNPQRHEAPLVLGHPSDNKPAYGWVKNLHATADGRLLMLADQIDPAFADGVQSGRFKKRSASFYPPGSSANPTPGQWHLKHVGWLGAQAPAVKGLADASFGMPSRDGAISFEV